MLRRHPRYQLCGRGSFIHQMNPLACIFATSALTGLRRRVRDAHARTSAYLGLYSDGAQSVKIGSLPA